MGLKLVALVWFFSLGLSPVVLTAREQCCDAPTMTCCVAEVQCKMPCCKDGECEMPCCKSKAVDAACCRTEGEPTLSAIDILLTLGGGVDLSLAAPNAPSRQTAVVWFNHPVFVGRNLLQGKYVIEHDTERMARGEPCTHIYAANDMTKPVVTFHCTHIAGTRTEKNTVWLATLPDGMRKFVQFQFAGDDAAHGFPTAR